MLTPPSPWYHSIQPPIALHGLSGKYASATYTAALRKGPKVLTQVESELNDIQANIKSKPDIASFLTNPTLSAADRAQGIKTVLSAASFKAPVSEITKNLLEVLADNGRLAETSKVIEGFNQLTSAYRGEVEVTVTSAQPLEKTLLGRLEASLKSSSVAGADKKLKITNKVCVPSLTDLGFSGVRVADVVT